MIATAKMNLAARIAQVGDEDIESASAFADRMADAIDVSGHLGYLGCLAALIRALPDGTPKAKAKAWMSQLYSLDEVNFTRVLMSSFADGKPESFNALALDIACAIEGGK